MVTTDRKELTCIAYKDYLEIIDKLGNKLMLQKHLIILAIELGVAKNKTEVLKALKELEENEIIKKINFMGTSNKIILFKKYAIRFLAGKKSSGAVASVPSINSNIKYIENIFKIHIIINTYLKQIKEKSLSNLLDYMDNWNSNLLVDKNGALKYYVHNLSRFTNKKIINKKILVNDINELNLEKEQRNLNLSLKNKDFIEKTNKKPKKTKTKQEILNNSTVATLIRKNIYFYSLYRTKDGVLTINCFYLDLYNSQSPSKIIFNCAIVYKFFKRILMEGVNFKLNFSIYTFDSIAQTNISNYLRKELINPNTGQKTGEKELHRMFKAYNISELDFKNISVSIKNIDMENNYLDGIKKASLTYNK